MTDSAPKMSHEEQDYINSLPIRSRPLAIYQLQAMECTQIRNFIQFLREKAACTVT